MTLDQTDRLIAQCKRLRATNRRLRAKAKALGAEGALLRSRLDYLEVIINAQFDEIERLRRDAGKVTVISYGPGAIIPSDP